MNSKQKADSTKYTFAQNEWQQLLRDYFIKNKAKLNDFGSKVNQTFEAAVFAITINWFRKNSWEVHIVNPEPKKKSEKKRFILKFNTRGAPKNYSYALCKKDGTLLEIRHQLRVQTIHQPASSFTSSNIVCDIAIIESGIDFQNMPTGAAIENRQLKTFGEVKHMSAYAELVANFIGLAHELRPENIVIDFSIDNQENDIPYPFLYVSGTLNGTAKALSESISERNFGLKIYYSGSPMSVISAAEKL